MWTFLRASWKLQRQLLRFVHKQLVPAQGARHFACDWPNGQVTLVETDRGIVSDGSRSAGVVPVTTVMALKDLLVALTLERSRRLLKLHHNGLPTLCRILSMSRSS
jgi:hypothetical protein